MSIQQAPQITISGKKYIMPKPKIKLWRHMLRFTEAQKRGELEGEAILDAMEDLIALAFNNPAVTRESIEESFDIEEISNIISGISQYVTTIANGKAAQIPNGATPART